MLDRILNYFNLNNYYFPNPIAQLASREDCEKFIDQSINDARFERLIAVGYGTLAVITAIAITALAFTCCFVGFGLVAAGFYKGLGLVGAVTFAVHGSIFSGIATPFIAYYPVKKESEYFFNLTLKHWNQAQQHYNLAHLASLRKAEFF